MDNKTRDDFIYNLLRQEEEIDLIFYTNDNKKACFVECKWRNQKVGMDVLNDLIRKALCVV